jgi:excisionase family DNA binding protein
VAAKGEFYSFDEALKELRLKEEELKRLVSEGEIRAFREGDTMKLRRADVENLRAELSGGEVVDLGDVEEELVFEDDVEVVDDTGMATQEIGDVDTVIDDGVEVVGEIELEAAPAVEEEIVEEVEETERVTAPRAVEVPEPYEGVGVRIALVAATLLMILSVPLIMSAGRPQPSGLAKAIAGVIGSHE